MAKKKLIRGLLLSVFSLVFLILPTAILFYIKRDKYFIENGGSDVTMGFLIGMVYVMALLKGALKELNKHFSRLLGMVIFLVVVWFFDSIITDLFYIITSGIVGYSLFALLSTLGRGDLSYHKEYRTEKARIEARSEINGRG